MSRSTVVQCLVLVLVPCGSLLDSTAARAEVAAWDTIDEEEAAARRETKAISPREADADWLDRVRARRENRQERRVERRGDRRAERRARWSEALAAAEEKPSFCSCLRWFLASCAAHRDD